MTVTTMDRAGYAGQLAIYGGANLATGMRLLVGRRYQIYTPHSYTATGTPSSLLSAGYDLRVEADGTLHLIGDAENSLTVAGTSMTVDVTTVTYHPEGYTGQMSIYGGANFTSNPGLPGLTAFLMRNRRYHLYAPHSFATDTVTFMMSSAPDLRVDTNGDVFPEGSNIELSLNISGRDIRAIVTIATFEPQGYTGQLAIYGMGTFSPTLPLLRNRRYRFYAPWSFAWDRDVDSFLFDEAGPDLLVDQNSVLSLQGNAADKSFEISQQRIRALVTPVNYDPRGYPGGIAIYGMGGFSPTTPLPLLRNRRYRFYTPWSFGSDVDTFHFSASPELSVSTGNQLSLTDAARPSLEIVDGSPPTLRVIVSTATYLANGYPGPVAIYGVSNGGGTVTLMNNRRYRAYAPYSYRLTDTQFFFSDGPDIRVDQFGTYSPVGSAIGQSLDISGTSTLATKVGLMTITKTGYNGPVSVYGHAGATAGGTSPLTTVLLRGRRYRIFPSDTMVTMSQEGVCTPTSIDVPGGKLDIICSNAVVSPPGFCANQPNGTLCQDGNACTATDSCQNGHCAPGSPTPEGTACGNQGVCSATVCASPSGFCNGKPNGVGCEDGSTCTNQDACNAAGVCVGVPLANTPACSSAPPDPPTPAADPLVGGAFNGALKGELAVSQTGAAIYTVPIAIPPGVKGMAPNLGLVYNSQGRNGIAGQGWELAGLSMIHLCPKTRVQDGLAEPIKLPWHDAICLDGERVRKDAQGNLFFESEQFSSIRRVLDPDTGILDAYEVRTKSGETRIYGERATTRVAVHANAPTVVWLIARVTDAWGNYFTFHYNDDIGHQVGPKYFFEDGINVTRIKYTGFAGRTAQGSHPAEGPQEPFWHVVFGYDPELREDVRYTRFDFIEVPRKRLLTTIKVVPAQSPDGPAVRTYTLGYLAKDTTHMLPRRLNSIQYCAVKDGATKCLKSLDFGWTGGGFGWSESLGTQSYKLPDRIDRRPNLSSGAPASWGTQLVDLDGDARPDFVTSRSGDRNEVWRNQHFGFEREPAWDLPDPFRMVEASGHRQALFADMNNDGQVDYVFARSFSDRGPKILLNRLPQGQGWVDGTIPVPDDVFSDWFIPNLGWALGFDGTKPHLLLDMNGDGRADIVDFSDSADVNVYLNKPSGWEKVQGDFYDLQGIDQGAVVQLGTGVTCSLRDINRDDLPDVLCNDRRIGINVGPGGISSGATIRAWKFSQFEGPVLVGKASDATRMVGDVDGDGHHDIVDVPPYGIGCPTSTETGARAVVLSTGSGYTGAMAGYWSSLNDYLLPRTFTFSTQTCPTGLLRRNHLMGMGDFNADGLADLVLNHEDSNGGVFTFKGGQLLVNTGTGWKDYDGAASRIGWTPPAVPGNAIGPTTKVPGGAPGVETSAVPADGDPEGYPFDPTVATIYVDLNGDGMTDIAQTRIQDGELKSRTWFNTFVAPMITGFPNGLAKPSEVSYVSISGSLNGVYSDSHIVEAGTTRLAVPLRVVRSIVAEDGRGQGFTSTTDYQYGDLRASATGRGPQGFKRMTVIDRASGVTTTTTYAQAYPYTGRVRSVRKERNGMVLSETDTRYCDATINITSYPACYGTIEQPTCTPPTGPENGAPYPQQTKPVFVYPIGVTDSAYLWAADDPSSEVHLIPTVTTYRYDQYGNAVCTVVDMVTTRDFERQVKTTRNEFGLLGGSESLRGLVTRSVTNTERIAPVDGNNTPRTHTTEFEYDGTLSIGGRLTLPLARKKVEPGRGFPLELHAVYAYDGRGNVAVTTECQNQFDPMSCRAGARSPVNTSDPPFRTTEVSYDPAEFNAPQGLPKTSLDYPERGRFPVKITNAVGHVEYVAYDPNHGTVIQKTGADGIHACHRYDPVGRLESDIQRCGSSRPLETTMQQFLSPEPGSAVITVSKPPTGAWSWSYSDVLGRTVKTRVRGFSGDIIEAGSKSYDEEGRLKTETKPRIEGQATFKTELTYDRLGRLKTTTQELGSIDGTASTATELVRYTYDRSEIKTERTVAGVVQKRSELKSVAGQVISVKELVSADTGQEVEIEYQYDADGNLTNSGPKNQTQNKVVIQYDDRGRKTRTTDPDMGVWEYEYDGFGQLQKQTDARNQDVELDYDALGRMIRRTDPGGATAQWSYDSPGVGIGKLAAVASAPDDRLTGVCTTIAGTSKRAGKSFKYTPLGEVEEISECVDGTTFFTNFEYDAAGRQSTLTYPDVRGSRLKVENHYTQTGYLHYVTDTADGLVYWAAKAVNARGQVTQEYTRNGVETVANRNAATGWLMGSTSTSRADGDKVIQRWGYTFDEAGNLRTRARTDQVVAEDSLETFGYDALNRLTSSRVQVGSYNVPESYAYDPLGNLTSKAGAAYTYTGCMAGGRAAGPHAVCTAGGVSYSYDDNGNMTSGGGRSVTYNARNKPVSFTQGGTTVGFIYGADGDRVVQDVTGAAPARTVYVGLGATGKSLYERTSSGGTVEKHVQFLYAGNSHNGNAFAVRVTVEAPTPTPTMKYNSFDHLGSITAMSDAQGRVAGATGGSWANSDLMGYDAWGARRNPDGRPASSNFVEKPSRRGFTGHETISGIGLVNMNGRVYDPALGRFLSPDPVVQFEANLQSYNRYSYVLNNPLSYTDPTGYLTDEQKLDIAVGATLLLTSAACAASAGTGCGVFMTIGGAYISTTASLARGASIGDAAASQMIGFGVGAFGGMVGEWVAKGPMQQIVAGAVSGAVLGYFSTSDPDNLNEVGINVLWGAARGAAAAAATQGLATALSKAMARDAIGKPYDGPFGDPATVPDDDRKNLALIGRMLENSGTLDEMGIYEGEIFFIVPVNESNQGTLHPQKMPVGQAENTAIWVRGKHYNDGDRIAASGHSHPSVRNARKYHPTARPEKLSELDISAQMTDGRMNVAITPGGVFLYKPGMLPTDVTNYMFPSGGMKILGEIYGR